MIELLGLACIIYFALAAAVTVLAAVRLSGLISHREESCNGSYESCNRSYESCNRSYESPNRSYDHETRHPNH
jgi:hypothetical protein